MKICDHGIDLSSCPLCRKVTKVEEPKPVAAISPVVNPAANFAAEPVRNPNAEITDPLAKSVLQLAEEYARAQDEIATIRAAVTNTRSMLKGLEVDLRNAEKVCTEKQEALHAAVSPKEREVKPRKKRRVLAMPAQDGPSDTSDAGGSLPEGS